MSQKPYPHEKCYCRYPIVGEPEIERIQPQGTIAFAFHMRTFEWSLEMCTATGWVSAPATKETVEKFLALHQSVKNNGTPAENLAYFETSAIMRMIIELHWWRCKREPLLISLQAGPSALSESKTYSPHNPDLSKTVYGLPVLVEHALITQKRVGDIGFERTADTKADCITLLTWTIVEWSGIKWSRVSPAGKEKLRRYIPEKFERDGTYVDALITTLMYTLLKLQEHEDGDHRDWIVE